MLEVHIRNTY